MTKLIWMSDLHFTDEGDVLGHDPRARLNAAVDHINTHHSDAEMCIISGDIVNRGGRADYEGAKRILDGLVVPYFPMVGNHDSRDLFRDSLPLTDTSMTDFIQYQLETPEAVLICLDTLKEGSDSGEFCPARMDWLRQALINAAKKSVLIFMHHPPMSLGLPMQDLSKVQEGDAFLDLLVDFDSVQYLLIGHVHRPITGTIRSIPFSTMRSVLYQAPPPVPEWTWKTFKPSIEAPSIGILHLEESSVNLQYDQFCEYRIGGPTL